jgi:predicted GNAT family acetyltransferase
MARLAGPLPDAIGGWTVEVVNNEGRQRFELTFDDGVAFLNYELRGDRIVLVHTEVAPDAEGMGVGSRLAKGALADVRARGLELTVECEFIAAYLKRHARDYTDLVADS